MREIQKNPGTGQAQEQGPVLHGERIWLRRPNMHDARFVFHWERDDEVWRYDPYRPYSQTLTEFLSIFERNYVRGNGRQFWFIIEDEQHLPIGTITYFNVICAEDRPRLVWASARKATGAKATWPKPSACWSSIFSPNPVLHVFMQRQPWPTRQHAKPSPELVL